ncbi:hypothetical protein SDC9_89916 [bioreactor metagenome]|uniref:RagB/SusD family nutrient uptake outer membrane protein n=1 Tax=bioreactor metagenome TaxID=1076179 RepID=A0A644ZX79_9ZZZZ|nr:RagB/SusD family nutrient uptake outer membrane protein [Paludibacter sp.]
MNKIKIFLMLLFFGAIFGACEKILEPDKDNQYMLDRVLNDPAFAEGILLRAYQLLPSEYTQEDVATDNAVSNNKSNGYLRMATGEWSAIYNPVSVWTDSYNALFNINYFLSVVDKVNWSWQSETRKEMFAKRFKGEALALRAYFHMRLLIHHGGINNEGNLLGIPLATEVIGVKENNWKLKRSTYQECIDQINNDFDQAFMLLPYVWQKYPDDLNKQTVLGEQNINRIQGKIIKALQARLALYTSSPAFNQGSYNQEKCREAAEIAGQLLVEIGGTGGMDPKGNIFYDKDDDPTNAEILWKNNYGVSNNREIDNFPPSLYGKGNINPTQNLVDIFPMVNGYPITHSLSEFDATNPYKKRDPRLKAYIVYNGNTLGAYSIKTSIDDQVNGLNKTTASTRTGYYLLKLLRTDVNLNPTVFSTKRHFYTHIRYTELFLIYAEAANEVWGPDGDPKNYGFTARSILASIRKRAGITASDPYLASLSNKGEIGELIRNERRIELCFEGFRFWDIRRWKNNLNETAKGVEISGNTYNYIDVEKRKFENYMYYGPLPNNEINKYEGLTQNQGW